MHNPKLCVDFHTATFGFYVQYNLCFKLNVGSLVSGQDLSQEVGQENDGWFNTN